MEKLEKEEKDRLDNIRASLTQADIEAIIENAKILKQRQELQQGTLRKNPEGYPRR